MLEIALTPSSFALTGRGNVEGITNVAWTPGIPPEDSIAATISRPVSMLLPSFKWIFVCDLIDRKRFYHLVDLRNPCVEQTHQYLWQVGLLLR